MFKWLKRKPRFKEEFNTIINTITFTVEMIEVDTIYYWGATDKANIFHQYLSPQYSSYEVAKGELSNFLNYLEEQTYGNY
jgi:hypothetical protein